MDEGDLPGNCGNGSIRCSQNACRGSDDPERGIGEFSLQITTNNSFHTMEFLLGLESMAQIEE